MNTPEASDKTLTHSNITMLSYKLPQNIVTLGKPNKEVENLDSLRTEWKDYFNNEMGQSAG